jgi:hypothetical protein
MNIKLNSEGWRFDESVGWKLIHNDIDVIFFEETDKAISTQEKLFVGTKEECEAEITRLDLKPPHEIEEVLDDDALLETEAPVSDGAGGII